MTGTREKGDAKRKEEENTIDADTDEKITVIIETLTEGAAFFDPPKQMDYTEPEADERNFYFMECEKVVFHKDGKALLKTEGSGKGLLPAHVGVTIIRGRSKVESKKQ